MWLGARELDKLANTWDFHRRDCHDSKDIQIELLPGGGIGTVVQVTCGCGKKIDVTDYFSW